MVLEVLYQDADYVAINKPAGLLVHRSALASGETVSVVQLLRQQLGTKVYPVHRLDRPTSGALVMALSSEAARHLSAEFAERRIEKTYLAIVRGVPPREATIDYPLKEELDEVADFQAQVDKPAQDAITCIQTVATVEFPVKVDRYPTSRYALVKAFPKTGRRHQIRRHLRHLGHPIIGDVNHGVGKHNRFFANEQGVRRLLLACTDLNFKHPGTGSIVRVSAPLCEAYTGLLKRLNWNYL